MAKRVSFQDSARPEVQPDGIVFAAEVDGRPVRCLVSKEALLKQAKAGTATEEELLKLFQSCKVKLREVAASLIRAGRVTEAGELRIGREDLA